MNERKHGARLLGLLVVAALGVMAFAASAQAVAPGFLVNGLPAGDLLPKLEGTIEAGTVGTMLVPGLNFELNCTAFTTDEGIINTNTDAKAVLLYTGCSTLSISKLPEEIDCHVKEPIKAEALLLPTELKKPVLDGPAILAEKIKALVILELKGKALPGEEPITPCILPLDNTVTGDACFQILPGTNDTKLPLLLANANIECLEVIALESLTLGAGKKDEVKYGAQVVTLDGSVFLHGLAPHNNSTFGVSLY
jgi:hypothetical protein